MHPRQAEQLCPDAQPQAWLPQLDATGGLSLPAGTSSLDPLYPNRSKVGGHGLGLTGFGTFEYARVPTALMV